jgi:hypothetical protein
MIPFFNFKLNVTDDSRGTEHPICGEPEIEQDESRKQNQCQGYELDVPRAGSRS